MFFALVSTPESSQEIILKVQVYGNRERCIDVPVTPETVCKDVLYLTQEPGDKASHHLVLLWNGQEQSIGEEDNLYEVLHQYEGEVKFVLRPGPAATSSHSAHQYRQGQYTDGRRRQRNEMRETGVPSQNGLPGGVDLTLSELQEMAARQQQQIEHQQQVLVAKEQRLKYLKQQEQRHQQIAAENDRLRKLREKVETQEMKLKKLRALRGEAEKYKNNNGGLNAELESVKALFSEKEKELVMAVAKVEELTKQLEDIQKEKAKVKNGDNQSAAAYELEKLKKELLLRNKLNEQQSTKLNAHREMLNQRKDEISKMDNRIHELQQRLKKKRAQQAEQKNTANQAQPSKSANRPSAAVEPYIQRVPNENTNNNVKSGFDKMNPKYQSLPVNAIKFNVEKTIEDKKSQKGSDQYKEQNNNLKKPAYQAVVRNEPVKENGLSSNSVELKSSELPPQQKPPPPPPPVTQNKPKQTNKPPPPLPVRSGTTGLTYLTPRPFGTTYSTSAIGRGQGNTDQQTKVPSIDIAEDVRTGGSGQSSPASSEGSQKEATVNPKSSIQDILSSNNQTKNQVNNNGSSVTTVNKSGPPAAPPTHTVRQRPPSSKPNLSATSQLPPQSVGANPPSVRPSYDQTDSSHSTKPPTDTKSAGSTNTEGNGPSASPMLSQGNQQNVNGSDSSLNSDSSSTGVKQLPTYRYASKNVIANTYMGKLGPEALKKYQQNVNLMYTNLNKNEDTAKSGENNNENISSSKQHSSNENQSVAPATSSSNNVPYPAGSKASKSSFLPQGTTNHPDIASDKASHNHNRHTPKTLRRRHSDSSDNEDVAKLLLKYVDRYNQNATNQERVNGDYRTVERYDTKATSFKDQIPETVPVDSMGNLMDDNKNSDNSLDQNSNSGSSDSSSPASVQLSPSDQPVLHKKTNLKMHNAPKSGNRVSFDPLALLLDASLEGELELVKRCARQVENVSEPNDEGITALHNAICAGHYDIVKFLVEFGCDVNSPDSDGWTPLHCAASCNNLPMVKFLVEHGACIFATTISDQETAAEKCEEDEDGFDGCSEYLYSVQEKLGIMNNGKVWAVFDYDGQQTDELSFKIGDDITVLKRGDDKEKEWWWSELNKKEGYIPRNLLGLHPRVLQQETDVDS